VTFTAALKFCLRLVAMKFMDDDDDDDKAERGTPTDNTNDSKNNT